MNVQDLRLGMPYYTVSGGTIAVAKISDLKFSDEDDVASAVVIGWKLSLPDFLQRTSIEWAIDTARAQLIVMLKDKTRTIQQDQTWSHQLAELETDGFNEKRARLEAQFAEAQPMSHFPLGTRLWYVQPDVMNMLVGPLVRLDSRGKNDHQNPWFNQGVIRYKNGQYLGVTHQHRFFDDKDKALAALAVYVEERYPVTLNRKRVKVVPTVTAVQAMFWGGD